MGYAEHARSPFDTGFDRPRAEKKKPTEEHLTDEEKAELETE